jgi:hypothetical protein
MIGILCPENKKAYISVGFYILTKYRQKYNLFENWYLLRAPDLPAFLRSTALGSLVRNPAAFSSGRRLG